MLTVFGYDHAPHGHGEVSYENVRIPVSNMLLGEGRGFDKLASAITHALIGAASADVCQAGDRAGIFSGNRLAAKQWADACGQFQSRGLRQQAYLKPECAHFS